MPKISMVMEFNDESELRAYLDGQANRASTDDAAGSYEHAPTQATRASFEPGATDAAPATEEPTEDSRDVDGMPYDSSVHSNPPSFTQDGRWRAARGKADEAKAARAAFLSSGGNEEPPADLPEVPSAAVAPETRAEPGLPELPGLPEPMPEPVTVEALFARLQDVISAGHSGQVMDLYQKHIGTADRHQVGAALQNDETKRAALMKDLDALLA